MNYLDVKIQKLERQNRCLTYAVTIIGLVFSLLFLLSATPGQKVQDEIVAHSIRVVNDQGENSAQLAATPDGFVGLSFTDLKGESGFSVMMTPSGKTSVDFSRNKRIRLELGVIDGNKGEEYSLQLKDREGKPVWQVPVRNPY